MTWKEMFRRPDYAQSVTGRLVTKSLLALVTRLAPGIATVVLNIAIGRIAGSSMLGLTQSITSSASIASLLYPTLAGRAASRYVASSGARRHGSEAREIASYLARRTFWVSLASAIILAIITLFAETHSLSTVAVSAMMVLALSGRTFVEGLHFGGGEGSRLAKWSLAIAVASLGTSIVLLLCGVRSAWVIAPLALLNIGFAALSWPRRARRLGSQPMRKEIKGFIALSMVGMLASSGFTNATVLIASNVNGLGYAGEYAAAFTLTTPLTLFASAISATLFPAQAAAHRSGNSDEVREKMYSSTSLMATIIIAILILVMSFSGPIVDLLWGSGFPRTSLIILFLLPVAALSAVAVPAVTTITSSSNTGMAVSAGSSVFGALSGIGTWIVWNPVVPEVGVPLGFAVGTLVTAAVPFALAWYKFKMHWFKESLVILITVGAIFGLAIYAHTTDMPRIVTASLGCIILGFWCVLRRNSICKLAHLLAAIARPT